jgi:type IV secretion system protein TrbL
MGWNHPEVRHAIISLRAIDEVFRKNPKYDSNAASSSADYNTPEYLFDPFMRDDKGRQTSMLSPGAMIKIGVVIADIVSFKSNKEFDAEGNLVNKSITENDDTGLLKISLNKIQEAVFSFLFTIGIILACAFCAIQYCMTLFEFFIITSVGIIFVPCILWDGTKSFATKLITLFLAYFFKLMLMIFCLFWVYGFFLDTGMTLITSQPMLSFLNIGYFIFAVLLGWAVTQNGPKLATTLLNGTPDLSMGEFMRAAGTAAAGAYAAKRAYTGAANAVSTAGKTAHAGLQTAGKTFAGLNAMASGVSEAVNAEGDKRGWNKSERAQRWAGGMAGLIGQNVKNSAATFLTGVENRNRSDNGISAYGKGIDEGQEGGGARGEQNYNRAKHGAETYMNDRFKNEDGKTESGSGAPLKNSAPPQDTTPRFDGKRDTDAV